MTRHRTGRACTCGGTAPGYPQHEQDCALLIGDRQARGEAAAARCPSTCTDPWHAHPVRAA